MDTLAYPQGTYTVSVRSKLNNIYNNYRSGSAAYTGRTVSETKTITLVNSPITSAMPGTGVYRRGSGFYLDIDNENTWNSSTDVYLAWDNAAADLPIAGDWNGDGIAKTGVYRPGVRVLPQDG